jgi:hypothetical protein
VASCDEIAADPCFANNQCGAKERCEDVGPDGDNVACCVPGVRGIGKGGDPCTNENDCESGVCIAGDGPYMCSQTCINDNECPNGMKKCIPIAFSGSDDDWCVPEN